MIAPRSRRYRRLAGRDSADPFEGTKTDGLSVRIVRLRGEEVRSPHRHPYSQEAIYVLSGHGVLWEDGVTSRFEAGDCALIGRGVRHATLPHPGTSMKLVCFFPHEDLRRNTEEMYDTVIRADQLDWEG
jgi:quercetin dioxygenase-like cupin family protein